MKKQNTKTNRQKQRAFNRSEVQFTEALPSGGFRGDEVLPPGGFRGN